VQERIEMLAQFEDGMQRKKSQLLIVDRGEDLAAPLVHELSYQCAVYDFLDSKLDGDVCVTLSVLLFLSVFFCLLLLLFFLTVM
jgi:hypothetical protein